MKRKDIILVAGMILLAALVLLAGWQLRRNTSSVASTDSAGSADAAAADADTSDSEAADADAAGVQAKTAQQLAEEYLAAVPAESYLYLEATGGALMIPLNEERSIPIDQGNDVVNTIHIGVNSVYMESSTCDNQNCVDEGEVTLENRDSRVLYNMIICIPHNLLLELMTPEEALETLTELYQAQMDVEAAAADASSSAAEDSSAAEGTAAPASETGSTASSGSAAESTVSAGVAASKS